MLQQRSKTLILHSMKYLDWVVSIPYIQQITKGLGCSMNLTQLHPPNNLLVAPRLWRPRLHDHRPCNLMGLPRCCCDGEHPKICKKHQSNQICLYKQIYEIRGKQDLWPRFLEFQSFSKMLCPFFGVRTNL